MVFCGNCGKEIDNTSEYCPNCGAPQRSQPNYQAPQAYDSGSVGWFVLGFFIPLAGLILYLVWMHDRPKSAKMSGLGALFGVIADVVSTIVFFIVLFSMDSIQFTSGLL